MKLGYIEEPIIHVGKPENETPKGSILIYFFLKDLELIRYTPCLSILLSQPQAVVSILLYRTMIQMSLEVATLKCCL